MKALDNIVVLDLSRVLAGPYCTQMLGDLGADILKIEKPFAGDDTRHWGPPYLQDDAGQDTSESAYYLSCNRNKKSVAIDFKSEGGRALIERLIAKSDILIHNFKVGGLEKYGLGYEQLQKKYPSLIYCAISGYGENGPLAHEPGYDLIAQGFSGLMACTGGPSDPPTKVGVALSDIMTGLNAAIGILAALHARQKTGEGQYIDVALTDCTLAALTNIAQYYLTSGENAPRLSNAHSTIVPYQTFQAADGHISIAVGNDAQFKRLCAVLDHPQWAVDPDYIHNDMRVQNRDKLVRNMAALLKKHPVSYWVDALRAADVPCGPVNTMDQVFEEPQIQARGMKIQMDHPRTRLPIDLVGSPLNLSQTPASYDLPPPKLGQHTKEVLEKMLLMPSDEIEKLKDKKIIQTL